MRDYNVLYKRVKDTFKEKGYIDLRDKVINKTEDLVELAAIFRSPIYETFRLFYMKGNKILGSEIVSSKDANSVNIIKYKRNGMERKDYTFYKFKNAMERLGADSYYMVHNHPSGPADASNNDIRSTQIFINSLPGYRGHLIINTNTYSWISEKGGIAVPEVKRILNPKKKDHYIEYFNKDDRYEGIITSREEFVSLINRIKNTKDFSILMLLDTKLRVRKIMDISNKMLNMKDKQLMGFIKNESKDCGAIKAFIATEDEKTFERIKSLQENQLFFTDAVLYKEETEGVKIVKEWIRDINESDIFKVKPQIIFSNFIVGEMTHDYNAVPLEQLSNYLEGVNKKEEMKNKIRILYKKVGEEPKEMLIDNTLEAKQKLVGGLIEVVPYEDLIIICNEEGKLLGLKPNLVFDLDYIAGDCFLIGDDYEKGDFRSLTQEEIIRGKEVFSQNAFEYLKQGKDKGTKKSHRGRNFERII